MTIKDLLNTKAYAHRGLHDAENGIIENSPSAIKAAIDAGLGIELDVQMSAERWPIVFHDEILTRLANRDGRLSFMKANELKQITYANSQDKIIGLDECLNLVQGKVPLLIEVKSHWHEQPQMEQQIVDCLKDYTGPYALMSFDPTVIHHLKQAGAKSPLGLITQRYPDKNWPGLSQSERSNARAHFDKAKALNIDFIAHDIHDLNNPSLIELTSSLNIPLFSWTINNDEKHRAAQKAKAIPIFEGDVRQHFIKSQAST